MKKASDLFIECLEEEGVEYIFGVPGEENLDFLDSLSARPAGRREAVPAVPGAVGLAEAVAAGVSLGDLVPRLARIVRLMHDRHVSHRDLKAFVEQAKGDRR